MKLQISITFREETKEKLMEVGKCLRECSREGRFTKKDNFRMNLMLLHGVDDLRPLKHILDKMENNAFYIKFNALDRSRRDGGDIWWAVAEESAELREIYEYLHDAVNDYEYEYDELPFKPRVELGKMVIARPNFPFPEFCAVVENITLIRCMKINKQVIYKELYKKELK